MLTLYVFTLIAYVIVITIADLATNKYYIKNTKKLNLSKKLKLILLLIIHNFIFYVQYFTIYFMLFNYKNISSIYILGYLFQSLYTMLHWITNNRRCFLTDMVNDLLDIPREKRIAMRDPLAVLLNIHYENDGTGTLRDDLYWIYLITVSAFCGTFLYIKQN